MQARRPNVEMDTAAHRVLEDSKQGDHGIQLEAIREAYNEAVTIFLLFSCAIPYPKKLGIMTDKLTRMLCSTRADCDNEFVNILVANPMCALADFLTRFTSSFVCRMKIRRGYERSAC